MGRGVVAVFWAGGERVFWGEAVAYRDDGEGGGVGEEEEVGIVSV